ncbi:MAG: serine O-acetyltransferase [Cytophagales bacterium]
MTLEELKLKLVDKNAQTDFFPATSVLANFVTGVLLTLFPQQSREKLDTLEKVEARFTKHKTDFIKIFSTINSKLNTPIEELAESFVHNLPKVYSDLLEDVSCILNGDPAATSEYEVIRSYPGFYAIAFYRIAHLLHQLEIPMAPRIITEFAHSKTGIDIHPAATIAPSFFIDHGTGIVIGGTAIIGRNVKLYQGVTLGALSVSKEMANTKRHPTIEDNVVIYAGATILGGNTIVGHDSVIGGNVWLTESVPANSKIYHKSELIRKLDTKV